MKLIFKLLTGLVLTVIALITYIEIASGKKLEAPYPEIRAVQDSAVIARGKYLAYGPAHCASCHVPMDRLKDVDKGIEVPMSGGWEFDIPPGVFRARNITPDMETGIGKLTDGELARTLRHSVGSDGRFIAPFMPFQEMSDEDLTAVISFLRAQEPVRHEVKPSELRLLGKALVAFGLMKPKGPAVTPPVAIVKEPTIEYGRYIANNVANCRACHTKMDMVTGEAIGAAFAGGNEFGVDPFSEGYSFVTPNLTPHKEFGHIAHWSEEAFVGRFKAGRVHKGSPMPWGSFSKMDETELKALYRYLMSLEPVANKIEKIVFAPGEEFPASIANSSTE
jgi:mono/diheme cytochrome c family protein